jgi:hypothetical protein
VVIWDLCFVIVICDLCFVIVELGYWLVAQISGVLFIQRTLWHSDFTSFRPLVGAYDLFTGSNK